MTDRSSLFFGGLILGLVLIDVAAFHGSGTTFLVKKLTELVEYLAFWR